MVNYINDDSAQTIIGTDGDDSFAIGTGSRGDGDDRFRGQGGTDNLSGGLGDDTLYGGDGVDFLRGGPGDDRLYGGDGFDAATWDDLAVGTIFSIAAGAVGGDRTFGIERFTGTRGNDVFFGSGLGDDLLGGAGNDTMRGEAGNDTLVGGTGANDLFGGDGNDVLSATAAFGDPSSSGNRFFGGGGRDLLTGGDGRDLLDGGDGDDTLVTGAGFADTAADTVRGGGGDDTVRAQGGADRLDGGAGTDTLQLFVDFALVIDLRAALADVAVAPETAMRISGFEAIETASGDDRITGTDGANAIVTNGGDDRASGGDGNDTLTGGTGSDSLSGGAGRDVLTGGDGADVLTGGRGADRFVYSGVYTGTPLPEDARDRITDFDRGTDRIDLRGIFDVSFAVDPDISRPCDFVFIGAAAFSGDADEVRFRNGVVEVDTNRDGEADIAIALTGVTTLGAADFLFG